LSIVARAECLQHDVELMVVMHGGLSQLRSDLEFLILVESQVYCVRGLKLLREKILHDKHMVRLHTRDAARALPIHVQLGRTALAVFRDKHVVAHMELWRTNVHLVVILLNSSFSIMRGILCHLCVNLRHSLRQLLNIYKLLRLDKSRGALTGILSFNISATELSQRVQ
jgi:hypothetical protein